MDLGPTKTWRLFLVFALLGLLFARLFVGTTPVSASAGINQTINFQGRLLNSAGATVPDGFYNLEFKIYQDGDGQSTGDSTGSPSGSLKWTEDYLNNNSQGVKVVNGFFSVQLGSINAFGSNVNWNQSVLWLSMNVGSTNGTCATFSACTPDGEMTPMQPLTSAVYSLNSGELNGLTSSQFGQLGASQTFTGANVFQPTTNVTGATVIQNSSGAPSADIFSVQSQNNTQLIQVTGAAVNSAAINIRSLGSGNAITLNSAGALTFTGAGASTWDIGNNQLSIQTTNNGAITTGTGLLTVGGNLTFGGTTARTITGPTTGGLTVTDATGPLTISTTGATGTRTLAVTSAGALNLTGAAPSTFDVGNNTLSLQTTSNGNITTGTGLLTVGGNISLSGATPSISSSATNAGITLQANGTGVLTLNTSGLGTVNIGTTNTTTVGVGNSSSATTVTLTGGGSSEAISNSGDLIKSTSTTAFQVQNAGGTATVLGVNTSTPQVSITNATGNNSTPLVNINYTSTSTSASTEAAQAITLNDTGVVTSGTDATNGLSVNVTRTGATGGTINTNGVNSVVSGDNAGAGTSNLNGVVGGVTGLGDNNTGVLGAILGIGSNSASTAVGVEGASGSFFAYTGTISTGIGVQAVLGMGGGGTLTTGYGVQIESATTGAGGTIGTNVGLQVQPQTIGGTANIGAEIGTASTQTLWLGYDSNTSTSTGGIAFGSSSDTDLYRGGASLLKTDSSLLVKTATNSSSALQVQTNGGVSVLTVDTNGTQTTFGQSGASGLTGSARFNYNGQSGAVILTPNNPSGNVYTLNLPAENGTLCSNAATSACNTAGALSNVAYLSQNQTFTGTNTFAPTTNITSAVVKQTSAASPTSDIFDVVGANGTANFIQVTSTAANAGAVNLTSFGSNNITLQSGSGTISLGSSTNLSATGALTVQAGGTNTLTLNTSGAGTVSLGTTNTTTVGIGSTSTAVTIEGSSATAGIALGNSNNAHNIQIGAGGTSATQTILIGSNGGVGSSTAIYGGSTGGISLNGPTTVNGSSAGSTTAAKINTGAASNTGLTIQGSASQASNLLQIQDSTGANLVLNDPNGNQEQLGYLDTPYGGLGLYSNLLTQSEAFDNAAWVKTNVTSPTANTVTAPDTTVSAESLADTSSGGTVAQTSGTAPSNNVYAFSVWLKTASGTQSVQLRIDGATTGTGTATTVTATTTWQRFFVTQNVNGFTGNIKVVILPGGAGTGTVSAWGAQLVLGSTPQVYIATGSSTVAAADGLISNGTVLLQNQSNSANAFQIQNASGTNIVNVNTSTPQFAVTATAANATNGTPLTNISYTSTNTTAAVETAEAITVSDTGVTTTGVDSTYGENINVTHTGQTGGNVNTYGLNSSVSTDNAGSGVSASYGVVGAVTGSTDTGIGVQGNFVGVGGATTTTATGVSGGVGTFLFTGNIGTAVGLSSVINSTGGAGSITTAYGAQISSATVGNGGTIGTNIGLQIQPQSVGGTANYGAEIGTASTQTLWLGYDANNTTASAGIAFGSSSDTDLYRGGASLLKTDSDFLIKTSTNATNALQVANNSGVAVLTADTSGGIVSVGQADASGLTGQLKFNFTGQAGSISLVPLTPSSTNYTLNLPAENGTLCSNAATSACNTNGALSNVAYLGQNQTFTGTNTFAPTTNISSAVVKQTSAASPTADTFDVTGTNGTSNYIQVTSTAANNGAVNITSFGGSNAITLQSGSGTVSLGNSTTLSSTGALTVQAGGTNILALTTSGAGTVNVGTSNATAVNVGSTSANLTEKANSTYTLDGNTGTNYNVGASTTTGNITIGSTLQTTGTTTVQAGATSAVLATGGLKIKTTTNSTTALYVQNNGGFSVINVDTSGNTFKVLDGTATGNYISFSYNDGTSTGTIAANTGITAIGNGTGAINITAGSASAVTITANTASNWTTTSGLLTIQGNGGLTLNSIGANAVNIDSTTTGSVNIGSNANSKGILLGNTQSGSTVTIDGGSGGSAISIQAAAGGGLSFGSSAASVVTIGNNSATSTFTLESGTGTTALFNGATAHTINLGTGAAIQTIVIGSTNSTSTLKLQGGSGNAGVNIVAGGNIQIGTSDTTGTLLTLDTDTDATFSQGTVANSSTEVDGAMFYNSTNDYFMCGVSGQWETCTGLLYSNTAASSAVNTCTTACTAFSTNNASTIPANYCEAGRVIHVEASGVYSTVSATTPTLAFGIYYGTSTTIASDVQVGASTPAITTTSGGTNNAWRLNYTIICYSATTMNAAGTLTAQTSATSTVSNTVVTAPQTGTTTVTSTSAKNFYIAPTWGTSNAGNTATLQQLIITGN